MWNTVEFNSQNIKAETSKATLIQLPNKSNYNRWGFFHPSKLIRDNGGNGYFKTFSFTDDWEFKLIRVGTKNNAAQVLTAKEMKEIYSEYQDESYLKVTEPIKVTKDVEVHQELKR